LAGAARDVAVDQRSGRVFITDTGPERFLQKMVAGSGGLGAFMPLGPGSLHVLDARTGAPLALVSVGMAPNAIAVDERRNRVYVVNAGSHDAYGTAGSTSIVIRAPIYGPGGLSVLDATSGRLLRSVALGTQPSSIALDAPTGQIIIGDTGDSAPHPQPDPWGWLPRPVRRFLAFLPQHAPPSRPHPARIIVVDTSHL
jgi:DNA-binding beta-propeller fold protein YncE